MATTASEQRRLQIMFGILAVLAAVFLFRTFVGGGGGDSGGGTAPVVTTTTVPALTTDTTPDGEPVDPGDTTVVTAPLTEPNTRNPFEPNPGAGAVFPGGEDS